ncbi:MAG: YafY family transcriptional regulator [Clostridia bacterium]|nr:YafY family transcriptional regulator [Clostridia bacterium]
MKFQVMTGILFTLLARRKVSASYLAGKYGVSVRSIYRYIDEMTVAGVPIDVVRGAQGGIFISDAFTLSKGLLTKEEYRKTLESLLAMNEQLHDETLSEVIEKLNRREKAEERGIELSGNIMVDGGTWGDERKFSDLLSVISHATEERKELYIEYADRGGERTHRTILPHLLVLKQNIWYVYAYCKLREEFRLFKLGRIRSVINTGESFERLPFKREDIPLSFWKTANEIDAKFKVSPECLPFVEEWLGVQNVYEQDGEYFAEAFLPDDDALIGRILSVGAGFKVLSPESLVGRVKDEIKKLSDCY